MWREVYARERACVVSCGVRDGAGAEWRCRQGGAGQGGEGCRAAQTRGVRCDTETQTRGVRCDTESQTRGVRCDTRGVRRDTEARGCQGHMQKIFKLTTQARYLSRSLSLWAGVRPTLVSAGMRTPLSTVSHPQPCKPWWQMASTVHKPSAMPTQPLVQREPEHLTLGQLSWRIQS